MYNSFFRLSCSPFENTLDQRFLFLSDCHREVIAALFYFATAKKGFALVCGDIGTGKTMIVSHLLEKLPRTVLPILIPYPCVEYVEILRYIARSLSVKTQGKGVLELSDAVKTQLTKASSEGRQVILIIDEAHLLPVLNLENIRLLSNMELTDNKPLQILLIGQSELALTVRKPQLRQLRQRININRVLFRLNPLEVLSYIDHRLRIAGSSFNACFKPDCDRLIYKLTGGAPRDINRLCDTALLVCMAQKADKVTKKILKMANQALKSDSIVANEPSSPAFYLRKLKPALAAAALIPCILLTSFAYRMGLCDHIQRTVWGRDPGKNIHAASVFKNKSKTTPAPKPAAKTFDNALANSPPGPWASLAVKTKPFALKKGARLATHAPKEHSAANRLTPPTGLRFLPAPLALEGRQSARLKPNCVQD